MITVIGSGPAGAYAASLLAKEHDVQIFEEHPSVGLPVQCTGIVTGLLADIIPVKNKFVLNKIGKARIFSPNNSFIDLSFKRKNLVLDRTAFDRYLVEKAVNNGAVINLNHRFKSLSFAKDRIHLNLDGKIKQTATDILIGADGPLSQVAKSSGLFNHRNFVVGLQARVSLEVEPDMLEIYANKDYFGWVVPESDRIARIGIVSSRQQNIHFKKFLKKRAANCKVREYQSGIIPVYNPKIKASGRNVYLVGDAAAQVKATTFGGIVQGLTAAKELSDAINHKKDYEKTWRKKLAKDLWLSLMIRKKLDSFSDERYDELIKIFKKERVKKIIETFDRDVPSKFILKLLLREPRLLKFIVS